MKYYNIMQIRQKNKLSQSEVAKILNIQQVQYSRYETGTREIPVQHLITLSQYYGGSTDYLLGLDTVENRNTATPPINKSTQSEAPSED